MDCRGVDNSLPEWKILILLFLMRQSWRFLQMTAPFTFARELATHGIKELYCLRCGRWIEKLTTIRCVWSSYLSIEGLCWIIFFFNKWSYLHSPKQSIISNRFYCLPTSFWIILSLSLQMNPISFSHFELTLILFFVSMANVWQEWLGPQPVTGLSPVERWVFVIKSVVEGLSALSD